MFAFVPVCVVHIASEIVKRKATKSTDASRACRWQSATWSSFGISYQSRRLSGLLFFGHAVLGVQNPVSFQCFWCVLKICVSPRSLAGGGSPGAQDLQPQHHQNCLVAMSLSLFFADTSAVLLFHDVGIGLLGVWVGPSAVIL